jgi:hypothetical protein
VIGPVSSNMQDSQAYKYILLSEHLTSKLLIAKSGNFLPHTHYSIESYQKISTS